jgi:hypothetical protein
MDPIQITKHWSGSLIKLARVQLPVRKITGRVRRSVVSKLTYFRMKLLQDFYSGLHRFRIIAHPLMPLLRRVRIPHSESGNRLILIRPGCTVTRAPLARSSLLCKTVSFIKFAAFGPFNPSIRRRMTEGEIILENARRE